MRKILFIFLGIVIISKISHAQIGNNYMVGDKILNAESVIDSRMFHTDFIEDLIFNYINSIRFERGYEPYEHNTVLYEAAKIQTDYMSSINDDTYEQKNKNLLTTRHRLLFVNGSGRGKELITKEMLKKSGMYYTYNQLAENTAFKWFNSSRDSRELYSDQYTMAAVAVSLSEDKRRIFVSLLLGDFLSLNDGAIHTSELAYEITQPPFFKWKQLQSYDDRICRKIDQLENLSLLQGALTIDNQNQIYIEFNNARALKRFLREKKDGIAVDIITKDQYLCDAPNKVNYALENRGILLSPIYTKEFWKKNEIQGKYVKEAKVPLGTLPTEIANSDYELNLLLIQNQHVCKSIPKSYLSTCEGKYTQNLELLADTITINSKFNYKPVADSTKLSFKIPFEKKKFHYKTEDIEPFLKLLNEPDFIIFELKISAFSSIEGIMKENNMLQKRRAESIIQALRDRQRDSIISEIKTEPAWEQFKNDIASTQHNVLASMQLQEAQEYISKYELSKKLEPILKNHRYAQIDMKISYDISGLKEQNFVISKFNKAIEKRDLPMALSIQKFIMKRVINGKYSMAAVYNQKIPEETQFAGLLMNKLWLEMRGINSTPENYTERIAALHELDKYNEYIAFNYALCQVLYFPIDNERVINTLQNDIDRFYHKSFTKETVDNLNMRFQFKVINIADSLDNKEKIIEARLQKIKDIVEIKDESVENSLRLAELFIINKDYKYAMEILETFIESPKAPEELIFTYLSLGSRFEEKMLSRKFARTMHKARQINHDRLCQLFDGEHFSHRIFENPEIKELVCKQCSTLKITKGN